MGDDNEEGEEEEEKENEAREVEEEDEDEEEDEEGHELESIRCQMEKSAWVKRSMRSKWRMDFGEYPLRTYPDYCSGWAILYPQVRQKYKENEKKKIRWSKSSKQ